MTAQPFPREANDKFLSGIGLSNIELARLLRFYRTLYAHSANLGTEFSLFNDTIRTRMMRLESFWEFRNLDDSNFVF
jgi:hypothetical protein